MASSFCVKNRIVTLKQERSPKLEIACFEGISTTPPFNFVLRAGRNLQSRHKLEMESVLCRSSPLKQSFSVVLYNTWWLYRPANQRTVQPTALWSFPCLFLKPSYIHICFIKKYYAPNPCQLTPDIILPFHFIYSPEHIVLAVHLLVISSSPLSFNGHLPTHHSLPQRLSPHPGIHFPALPSHHGPTLRNIVLDCLADAIILGLYLHNHISHLHSWVLTEARQVKHHTRGGQNDGGPPGA